MTLMHPHFSSTLAVVGACALGAGGCATSVPPTDQMAAAEASVAGAKVAGAQAYAPSELLLATDKLAHARRAMADGDHDLTLQLAQQAHSDAQRTERGLVITLDDALFDSDRAELPSGGLRDMAKLVEFFERHPTRTALIEGFTDSRGSKSANLDLSLRRAGALRHALIDEGVFAGRLETRGYGDAHPASTNSTAAGRRMNRRVEIVLSGDDGIVSAR
jgi:outer membrane protein OmpA-like peptidoglycan-associated protein